LCSKKKRSPLHCTECRIRGLLNVAQGHLHRCRTPVFLLAGDLVSTNANISRATTAHKARRVVIQLPMVLLFEPQIENAHLKIFTSRSLVIYCNNHPSPISCCVAPSHALQQSHSTYFTLRGGVHFLVLVASLGLKLKWSPLPRTQCSIRGLQKRLIPSLLQLSKPYALCCLVKLCLPCQRIQGNKCQQSTLIICRSCTKHPNPSTCG